MTSNSSILCTDAGFTPGIWPQISTFFERSLTQA